MDEQGWLALTNPAHLLLFVRERLGDRQLRLFACACCRRVARLLKDRRARAALDFAERMADRGAAGRRGRPAAYRLARQACGEYWAVEEESFGAAGYLAHLAGSNAAHAAMCAVEAGALAAALGACSTAELAAAYAGCKAPRARTGYPPDRQGRMEAERREQVLLLRDILGNPFRPLPLSPSLLTPTILSLAQASYSERLLPQGHLEPARLAVLADALEEVGCADEGVLGHLRGPGPHVRGCHVVDAVLGRQ